VLIVLRYKHRSLPDLTASGDHCMLGLRNEEKR